MGQPAYTENLHAKCGMQNSKPVSTPADPSQKLVKRLIMKRVLISNNFSP